MQQKNKARHITSAEWYGNGKYTVTTAGLSGSCVHLEGLVISAVALM